MAPTFTGDKNEKPIKFLKEMRRYLQPSESPLEELKYLLSRNLKGNAASWWYVVEDSVQRFEDFEEQFRDKFWSEEVTEALVRRIENGTYTSNGPLSRVDYTIELMSFAQDFDKYSEEEFVKKLAQHHDLDIRFMVKSRGVKDRKTFMNLLQCKDSETRRDRRPRVAHNNEQEPQRNFPPRHLEQRGQNSGNCRENEERNRAYSNQNNNNARKFGGQATAKNTIDVHALDRDLQQNPMGACGLSSENGV